MGRIAKRPMNDRAVRKADDDFYAAHPELVVEGVRIPLDPHDAYQEPLRDEWLDFYEKHGGRVYFGTKPPPTNPDPDEAILMVKVVDENDNPISGAKVELVTFSPEGRTGTDGMVNLGVVPAPMNLTVKVSCRGYEADWESELVDAGGTHVLWVDLEKKEGKIKRKRKKRGVSSRMCRRACDRDPEIKDILNRVIAVREKARDLHLWRSVAALQHFLDGSGEFRRIPVDIVEYVQDQSWDSHRNKCALALQAKLELGMVKTPGVRGSLANVLARIEKVDGAYYEADLLPPSLWPEEVSFDLSFASGEREGPLDHIANPDIVCSFFGSVLRSEFRVWCTRVPSDEYFPTYTCKMQSWRTYVVDNYDWEGNKEFIAKKIIKGFPTQKEMRRLARAGCAKAYQRSSTAWVPRDPRDFTGNLRIKPWSESFSSIEDIRDAGARRKSADAQSRKLWAGELSTPPPADEVR